MPGIPVALNKNLLNEWMKNEQELPSICADLYTSMATHSSVLAWRIPGTGEPGGLPSMGLHRVWHDWSDLAVTHQNWIVFESHWRQSKYALPKYAIFWHKDYFAWKTIHNQWMQDDSVPCPSLPKWRTLISLWEGVPLSFFYLVL